MCDTEQVKELEVLKVENDELKRKNTESKESCTREQTVILLNKVNDLLKRGYNLVYPQRTGEWAQYVISFIKADDGELILENALVIMEALEKGVSLEEAKEILIKQENSILNMAIIRNIIFYYSTTKFLLNQEI